VNRVDALYAAITARAARQAGETAAPRTRDPGARRNGLGLAPEPESDVPCEMCATGWAIVDLFTPDRPDGRPACARCAERTRMRHATYRFLGPAVYYPRRTR
jgi:hypothetical protein